MVLGKDRQSGGCTRSVAVGGQWTQARLYGAGYTQDARCQACGDEEGTLVHRHLVCPAWEGLRRTWLSPELRRAIKREGLGGAAFAAKGLFPIANLPPAPAIGEEQRRSVGRLDCIGVTGDVNETDDASAIAGIHACGYKVDDDFDDRQSNVKK